MSQNPKGQGTNPACGVRDLGTMAHAKLKPEGYLKEHSWYITVELKEPSRKRVPSKKSHPPNTNLSKGQSKKGCHESFLQI